MPGPISEEAFARTSSPNTMPAASGGPLIATEATSAMVASKLENGEPVLTLRIAPVVTPQATAVETADPDNAVEPTVISAPPTEQALAAPAVGTAPAAEPVAPPPPPVQKPAPPKAKPAALHESEPAPEPVRRAAAKPARTPARVTTVAAPAHHSEEEPAAPPTPDPLNAPYVPSSSPTLGNDEVSTAPATGAPASMAPAPSSGGPTPLTMPQ
jgi:hypothetical protein